MPLSIEESIGDAPDFLVYVYILLCIDRTHYTGITKQPATRIRQHLTGECSYTHLHPPKKIVYLHPCDSYAAARRLELYIKHRGAARYLLTEQTEERFDFLQDIQLFS